MGGGGGKHWRIVSPPPPTKKSCMKPSYTNIAIIGCSGLYSLAIIVDNVTREWVIVQIKSPVCPHPPPLGLSKRLHGYLQLLSIEYVMILVWLSIQAP